jgi:2,3-bisphosphoglycerate-independent phosphoglycerate mutase
MSTEIITDQVIYELDRIETSNYSFVLINFASPDMVGHTGDLQATIRANECADQCTKRVVEKTIEKGGAAFIIADHGNCETMIDRLTHKKNTAHTNNPVPMIFVHDSSQLKANGEKVIKVGTGERAKEATGILADVAPSILRVLDVEKPFSMTGIDLVNII